MAADVTDASSGVSEMSSGGETGEVTFDGMNSPWAISSEVLPSSTTLEAVENQPPGKNREDVVDSSRERVLGEDTVSLVAGPASSPSTSSTGARRETLSLEG